MSEISRTEIASLGEFGLIDHLTKQNESRQSSTIKSVGDDAAVIQHSGQQTLISTDILVEQVHFDLMYTPLKHLGYKSVVVNLSDIYAMNAIPTQLTFSMALSNRFSVEALEELYDGVYTACRKYNVDLVGGDTTSSNKGLLLSVTAIGHCNPDTYVGRDTAREGDLICVSGDLGAAYLGLQLLEREKQVFLSDPNMQPNFEDKSYTVGRFLKPEARADIIQSLADLDIKPTSMIDVSDGLSSDLRHICEQSNVGAAIFEAEVPIYEDTYELALKFNHDPITCALNGGEDYELLFTIDPKDENKLNGQTAITVIGEVKKQTEGVHLVTKQGNVHDLIAQGWVHLKDK